MRYPELQDRVVIVTGASRGIGLATAQAFHWQGARVVLAARSRPDLERASASLGDGALAVPTDVTDEAQVRALIGRTLDHFGRLDGVFNNAGEGHRPTAVGAFPVGDFDRIIAANLRSAYLVLHHAIAPLRAAGGGVIVNMSSTAGVSGAAGMGPYAAAKHAVVGLTRCAALDYARDRIRVNVVSPGPVATERIRALPEASRVPIAEAVPMGRIGLAEEVAATVLWLCSDGASFVTGANIVIDGGRTAGTFVP